MKRVITYGTFDLLHYGHINLLRRARELGDYLVVALSTDEFNWNQKQKKCYFPYEERKRMLEAIRYVDLVIRRKAGSRRPPMWTNTRSTCSSWATTGRASSTSSSPSARWSISPAPRRSPPRRSSAI